MVTEEPKRAGPDWEQLRRVPLGKAAPREAPGAGLAAVVRHYWTMRGMLAVREDAARRARASAGPYARGR